MAVLSGACDDRQPAETRAYGPVADGNSFIAADTYRITVTGTSALSTTLFATLPTTCSRSSLSPRWPT
jgi:hypothetical protein